MLTTTAKLPNIQDTFLAAARRSAAQVTMHRPAPAIAAAYTSHKSPLPPVFITGGNQP